MKHYLSILGFLLLLSPLASAQLEVHSDPGVEAMMARNTELNRVQQEVAGWCVQLISTTNREEMMKVKEQFLRNHPNKRIDWSYEAPYYRLKVGAYETRLDAARMFYVLRKDYKGSYIARDTKIRKRDML